MKRVAISGKGGSGKNTITATLARLTGRSLGGLLAVEGDPNPNLARSMGVERSEWPLLPKEILEVVEEDGVRRSRLAMPMLEVIEKYAVTGPDNVHILALGEVDHASQGCLCGKHAIVREVVGAAMAEGDEAVIVDMEASLEHMRRGTIRHVDTLLIITEPYYRALESAGRLVRLAREMNIPNVLGVANKVRSKAEEEAIRSYLDPLGVPLVAVIPMDDSVGQADLQGKALLDLYPDAPAVTAIQGLSQHLFA
ncbi:carbon monoxide dehydrogenase accessory protein CooC [soil metagenome]